MSQLFPTVLDEDEDQSQTLAVGLVDDGGNSRGETKPTAPVGLDVPDSDHGGNNVAVGSCGNVLLEDMDDPVAHKPDGENAISLPHVPLSKPSLKRRKDTQLEANTSASSTDIIPQNFRVKWVVTSGGLVPFVMNQDTQVIYCGLCRMQVFFTDGIATVICLKGCHWNCPGHSANHCGCHCHILQWHYRTRG